MHLPSNQHTIDKNIKKSSINEHEIIPTLRHKMSKKPVEIFKSNISTILFLKITGFQAFLKHSSLNPTWIYGRFFSILVLCATSYQQQSNFHLNQFNCFRILHIIMSKHKMVINLAKNSSLGSYLLF